MFLINNAFKKKGSFRCRQITRKHAFSFICKTPCHVAHHVRSVPLMPPEQKVPPPALRPGLLRSGTFSGIGERRRLHQAGLVPPGWVTVSQPHTSQRRRTKPLASGSCRVCPAGTASTRTRHKNKPRQATRSPHSLPGRSKRIRRERGRHWF